MFISGRSLLRRNRNRRVLSKHYKGVGHHGNEATTFALPPDMTRYLQVTFFVLLFAASGTFSTAIVGILFFLAKRYGLSEWVMQKIRNYRIGPPKTGPTVGERFWYYVDYWMSTNSYAKALVLVGLTLGLILTSGTLISCMSNETLGESLWKAALGSGLDWSFIDSEQPSLRLAAVCTNVGGLVLTALLLSLISDAVQTKYDSLRKGESPVTEQGHTLIIGWSVKILSVMTQLAKAGESTGGSVIVCLTDQKEKEDMESDIAQYDFNFAGIGTRVVCRSGSPLSSHDLKRVSFFRARSIIILGDDEHDAEANDAHSLQILLSIVSTLEREQAIHEKRFGPHAGNEFNSEYSFPRPERIVIEVMDHENAGLMTSVCPEMVEPVLAHDLVARLMLQAARNPLVADVWQDLLGFDGCETYSGQWAILRGLCFKDVLLCFEDAIPLGVKTGGGELMLNPPDQYIIAEGDEIIVLAEDDDTYCASINHSLIREKVPDSSYSAGYRYIDICPGGLDAIQSFSVSWARNPSLSLSRFESRDIFGHDVEKILFCGWRFDMGNLLQVYSAVAPIGSEFWILSEIPIGEREEELRLRGWECNSRVNVIHRLGASRRTVLAHLPLESFSSVIVGSSDSGKSQDTFVLAKHSSEMGANSHGNNEVASQVDARVINVVMTIQDIISRRNCENNAEASGINGRSNSRRREMKTMIDEPRSSSKLNSGGKSLSSSGLSRARSQRFLGAKNMKECTAPRGVIVGEIIDSRSRAMLSMVNSIDAVVASSELISKAVAMVSEDGSVNKFLNTLFDPYDSEITLETVDSYVDLSCSERVSFFELLARGRDVGTIILGYLVREIIPSDGDQHGTIRYTDVALNPPEKDLRRSWHKDDLLIVLTPGTSENSSVAPSEFLTDIGEISTVDMTRDFSWNDDVISTGGKRGKVRFSASAITKV